MGTYVIVMDVSNRKSMDSLVSKIMMAMKLAHGTLHVGDTEGHIQGHEL